MKVKCIALAVVQSFAFSGLVAAQEANHKTVLLILDNSGAVQDASSTDRTRPTFLQARRAMIEHLSDRLSKRDQLVILSVTRPKVVWEGPGNRVMHRNNFVLANYLGTPVNGCADFEKVGRVIRRQVRALPTPPTEIVVLSSLVHTGSPVVKGDPCPYDPQNYSPPEGFLDTLKQMILDHHTEVDLLWVDEGVIDDVDEYFFDAGVDVTLKGELQTIGTLQ